MKLTTHLSTPWGWKAELALLADLQRTVYTHKWFPISCRSGADQWKFADQRPTFYHWATQRTGELCDCMCVCLSVCLTGRLCASFSPPITPYLQITTYFHELFLLWHSLQVIQLLSLPKPYSGLLVPTALPQRLIHYILGISHCGHVMCRSDALLLLPAYYSALSYSTNQSITCRHAKCKLNLSKNVLSCCFNFFCIKSLTATSKKFNCKLLRSG